MNLRDYAQGKPCQVRIPEVCNGNCETTVLAHYRLSGISGMGIKAPDLIGAWACYECHDAVDRRRHKHLDRDYVHLCHLEGVMRTQTLLIAEGKISWQKTAR